MRAVLRPVLRAVRAVFRPVLRVARATFRPVLRVTRATFRPVLRVVRFVLRVPLFPDVVVAIVFLPFCFDVAALSSIALHFCRLCRRAVQVNTFLLGGRD